MELKENTSDLGLYVLTESGKIVRQGGEKMGKIQKQGRTQTNKGTRVNQM